MNDDDTVATTVGSLEYKQEADADTVENRQLLSSSFG